MGKKSPNKLMGMLSFMFSRLLRPIRNINLTRRTEKALSKDKLKPAPTFTATIKQKEFANKMNPNFLEEHYKKNVQLDDYLKKVYVTSKDPMNLEKESDSSKSMPQRGGNLERLEFPYFEINNRVPEGKCSLKDALIFMTNHVRSPNEYTAEKIADEYKLDKQVVANILKHFAIPIGTHIDSKGPKEKEKTVLLV